MEGSSTTMDPYKDIRLLRLSLHTSVISEIRTHELPNDKIAMPTEASWTKSLLRGIGKLWKSSNSGHTKALFSMVISACGTYVAVLDHFNAYFLTRENGFKELIGSNTGTFESGFYTCGTWLEESQVFIAATSKNEVLFLKTSGEELSRVVIKEFKGSGFILGIFSKKITSTEDILQLVVFTSSCDIFEVEIVSGGFGHPIVRTTIQNPMKRIYPGGVICHGYNEQNSILALIGLTNGSKFSMSSGKFCLSIWRIGDFWKSIEILGSISHLEDFNVSSIKIHGVANISVPMLILSPDCKFIGILDGRGRLEIIALNQDSGWSLERVHFSSLEYAETYQYGMDVRTVSWQLSNDLEIDNASGQPIRGFFEMRGPRDNEPGQIDMPFTSINDVHAFCWWSMGSIALLKADGVLSIVVVDGDKIVSRYMVGPYSAHLFTCQNSQRRHIFLLERVGNDAITKPESVGLDWVTPKTEGRGWRLFSLEEFSVLDLYKDFLDDADFDSALALAEKYGLNTEIVYKMRWLQSDYGLQSMHQNLHMIKDTAWSLTECLEKLAPDVEGMNDLLDYGLSIIDSCLGLEDVEAEEQSCLVGLFCVKRLRLLQYKDRLETYLALSMGRYNAKDYELLRSASILNVALTFAELGKLGALAFLYKRYMFTLTSSIFKILDAIPETIPPHRYTDLLPLADPPEGSVGRDKDWVETKRVLDVINRFGVIDGDVCDVRIQDSTEYIVKLCSGFTWPSEDDIVEWYKWRAMIMDRVSGQIENSLSLLDWGKQNGFTSLASLWQELSDIHQVVYETRDLNDKGIILSVQEWQCLSDFEKFKMFLKGVDESDVLDRLHEHALPFMSRTCKEQPVGEDEESTLLVDWLQETAGKQLAVCAVVFDEACKNPVASGFRDDAACIEAGLKCVYACTAVDQWDFMMSILSKLLHLCLQAESGVATDGQKFFISSKREADHCSLKKAKSLLSTRPSVEEGLYADMKAKLDFAIGHVEAGKLLSQYQVNKPIAFFETTKNDERTAKQLIHLLLSRFGRRYPERSDSEWALMWENLQKLQTTAFPFLNKQFLFLEYYRGLLKAGKFSLAKSQLKNLGSNLLSLEKAETVILQVAREYFYAASSLESMEIEKAQLCLKILPDSKALAAELGLIDAVTLKLPMLGVSLLPMQVRQVKDPMEIVKMAINNGNLQGSINVDAILEVAKLLGMSSSDHIAMVEEAIAREVATNGDILLAFNLCLSLIRQANGSSWDLCAALARGPEVEGLGLNMRKHFLGFALSYCDEASVEQLLRTWKELDYAKRGVELRAEYNDKDIKEKLDFDSLKRGYEQELEAQTFRKMLNKVVEKDILDILDATKFSKDKRKLLDILCMQLPWILERMEFLGPTCPNYPCKDMVEARCTNMVLQHFECCKDWRFEFLAFIVMGLANGGLPPKDNLICNLASLTMQNVLDGRKSFVGSGYLLNVMDYHLGINTFEQELQHRVKLEVRCEIMKLAHNYGLLQHTVESLRSPKRRRAKLFTALRNCDFSAVSGFTESVTGDLNPGFSWKEWQNNLCRRLQSTEHSVLLEKFIPCFDMNRFLSGDETYIKQSVCLLVESAVSDQRNKETQLSCIDRYQNMGSFIVDGEASKSTNIQVFEKRYNVFKRYIHHLDINFRWLCVQTLMCSICKIVLNGTDVQETSINPIVDDLLRFWVSVYEDALGETDRTTDNVLLTQIRPSLIEFKSCCSSFSSIVLQSGITGRQVKEVLLEVATESNYRDTGRTQFIHAMITSGCLFNTISLFWKSTDPSSIFYRQLAEDVYMSSSSASELSHVYATFTSHLIDECSKASSPNTCHATFEVLGGVVSSLSVVDEEQIKELHDVRLHIWDTIQEKAGNLSYPSFLRICLLDLLEAISLAKRKKDSIDGHIIKSVLPWEGWDQMMLQRKSTAPSLNFQHTVIALKSTELLSSTWQHFEVRGEEISSVEGATSIFKALASKVELPQHVTLLLNMLELWEDIFGYEKVSEDVSEGPSEEPHGSTKACEGDQDPQDGWGPADDDWDEVWENSSDLFKKDDTVGCDLSVHVLHACWKLTFELLIMFDSVTKVISLLDKVSPRSKRALLTRDEAVGFLSSLEKREPILALKVSLLLPYIETQIQALDSLNSNLEIGSILTKDEVSIDQCLLILILASGHLSRLADEPQFSKLFSLICSSVTSFSQDAVLPSTLMRKIIYPYFIATLVQTSRYATACALILQSMGAPPALVTWNTVFSLMHTFLSSKITFFTDDTVNTRLDIQEIGQHCCIISTVNYLRGQLKEILSSALEHCFKNQV